MVMPLARLVLTHRPETWGRTNSWEVHARNLWTEETDYMRALAAAMDREDGWIEGPVITDRGIVQDGHHRIVAALGLGWAARMVPVEEAP